MIMGIDVGVKPPFLSFQHSTFPPLSLRVWATGGAFSFSGGPTALPRGNPFLCLSPSGPLPLEKHPKPTILILVAIFGRLFSVGEAPYAPGLVLLTYLYLISLSRSSSPQEKKGNFFSLEKEHPSLGRSGQSPIGGQESSVKSSADVA